MSASFRPSFKRLLIFNILFDFSELHQPCKLAHLHPFHLELPHPQVEVFGGDSHNYQPLDHHGRFIIEVFHFQRFRRFLEQRV